MGIFFFCGHKSPYGMAHFVPLIHSNFEIIAIVLATDKRWNIFREKLMGKNYYSITKYNVKTLAKKIIPGFILQKMKQDIRKMLNIQEMAKKHKIPIWYVDDVNSKEFIQKIHNIQVDLIISAAYPQIFSKELISIPSRGAVNFHPSLLPKFRGAHPHYWAIVKGEEESGLSAHFMTEHIDNGNIIAQIKFPIRDYDYKQLYRKIIMETPNLVKKVEDFFIIGDSKSVKQDPLMVSYFRNDREIHHRIFWNIHTAQDIFNLIRGGNAFCFFRGSKIIIEKCFITETNRNLTNDVKVENGAIVDLNKDAVVVKANSGVINITKVKYRNRKCNFSEFIIKYNVLIGEKFD